jgi:signal transduction histidine kinase
MTAPTLAELRTIDLFDGLDDPTLGEWAAAATLLEVPPDTILAEQDGDVPGLQLLLEGEVRTLRVRAAHEDPVHTQVAPTWMGAIGALTGEPVAVRLRAATACRIAQIEPDTFRRLAFAHPVVHARVMGAVRRVSEFASGLDNERERLAGLGRMAAGLTHELNNPAAAARRAAAQLEEAMQAVTGAVGEFVEAGVEREDAARLIALQREAMAGMASRTAVDALDAADAEDALLTCLEDLGVREAWQYAEALASAGVDEQWVQRVVEAAGAAGDAALRWVAASLTAQSLAADLQESTRRMSDLVGAVKSYAYMDRGDLVDVDIHEGLESTVTILGHKLKHTQIEVVRRYAHDLPRMMVYGSQLNQVWTNLIDNAIDALGERGTVTLTTLLDGGCVEVHVADDGPGIPPEIRSHVFDAFVTTKDVGSGTGLGLATAYQIVVDRHDGSLTVDSEPGRTEFRVRLPVRQAQIQEAQA